MSTHHLVRDCELSESDLPVLRADKGVHSPTSSSLAADPSTYGKVKNANNYMFRIRRGLKSINYTVLQYIFIIQNPIISSFVDKGGAGYLC